MRDSGRLSITLTTSPSWASLFSSCACSGARAAHDLLVAAVTARDVDAHRDRLLGLVGDHDPLAHPARSLDGGMHRRERLRRGRGGAALGGLGAFLQAPRAAADGLRAALGDPLGVALLRRARGPGLAAVLRARTAAALLRRELLPARPRALGAAGASSEPRRRRRPLPGRPPARRRLGLGRRPRARRRPRAPRRPLPRCGGLGVGRLLRGVCLGLVLSLSGSSAMSVRSSSSRSSVALLGLGGESRSRATVSARARSRLARPSPAVSSSSPVAFEKRRPNTSLRSVATCLLEFAVRPCPVSRWPSSLRLSPRAARTWISPGACAPPGGSLRAPAARRRRRARTSRVPA